jgi:hypothetical protein
MLKHWERKVFKNGVINYNTDGSTILGYCTLPDRGAEAIGMNSSIIMSKEAIAIEKLEKVFGDVVFLVPRQCEDGYKDSVVMLAICSDGIWMKKPEYKSNSNNVAFDPNMLPYEDYVDMTKVDNE